MKYVLLPVVLVCLLAACTPAVTSSSPGVDAPEPTASPAPAASEPSPAQASNLPESVVSQGLLAEADWVKYENKVEGFSLALPPSWESIDLSGSQMTTELELLEVPVGFLFYAMDATEEVYSGASINLVSEKLPFPMPLDLYVKAALMQLNFMSEGSTVPFSPAHRRLHLGVGEVEEIKYQLQNPGMFGTDETFAFTQYIMIRGESAYALSFGSFAEYEVAYEPVVKRVIKGFHFTPLPLADESFASR